MTEYRNRLHRWFIEGPSGAGGEDGTLGYLLAMMVWWRMALLNILLGGGVLAVMAIGYKIGEPVLSAIIAFIIGETVGTWIIKISPKYEVTKNY
jgi:hypothetical protein